MAQSGGAGLETVRHDGRLLMAIASQPAFGFDRVLSSELAASGLPEVDATLAKEAVLAFINGRKRPFLFEAIEQNSALLGQLEAVAPHLRVMKAWQRAALRLDGSFDEWLASNFDHKRRKELKRLRNRLAEQGDLKFESLNQFSDLPRFVDGLLELEANGWKGKRGTAIASNEAAAQSFWQICENLQATGKLRFWQLTLNGKVIASLFGKIEGKRGWIVKIAYDEAFARFSPGVLLIINVTQALFAEGGVRLVDSCAIPGHPMIDRIWRERIAMVDVLIAPAHVSGFRFAAVGAAIKLRGDLRERAKSLFYAITKRKRS